MYRHHRAGGAAKWPLVGRAGILRCVEKPSRLAIGPTTSSTRSSLARPEGGPCCSCLSTQTCWMPRRGGCRLRHQPRAWIGLVFGLGLGGTGLAYLAYYYFVVNLGAVTASGVTYIPPVVALLIGAVLVGDDIHPLSYAATKRPRCRRIVPSLADCLPQPCEHHENVGCVLVLQYQLPHRAQRIKQMTGERSPLGRLRLWVQSRTSRRLSRMSASGRRRRPQWRTLGPKLPFISRLACIAFRPEADRQLLASRTR